jgi:hypothetical protein
MQENAANFKTHHGKPTLPLLSAQRKISLDVVIFDWSQYRQTKELFYFSPLI